MNENCFICEQPNSDLESRLIKEKGVNCLMKSSIARSKEKHERLLQDLSEIKVHIACYKRYTDSRVIAKLNKIVNISVPSYKGEILDLPTKNNLNKTEDISIPTSNLRQKRRKIAKEGVLNKESYSHNASIIEEKHEIDEQDMLLSKLPKFIKKFNVEVDVLETFNFMQNCFICGGRILKKLSNHKIADRRKKCVVVTKAEFQSMVLNVLHICKEEDFAQQIFKRVQDVPDWTAVGARYHKCCVHLLRKKRKHYTPSTKRKEKTAQIDKAMNIIDSYLKKHYNVGRYDLSQLMKLIENCDYVPSIKTIRSRLLQIYGENVLYFDSRQGGKTMVCFRGYENKFEENKKNVRLPKKPAASIKFCICIQTCKSDHACACRKAGVKCSDACVHCNGESCKNSLDYQSDSTDEDTPILSSSNFYFKKKLSDKSCHAKKIKPALSEDEFPVLYSVCNPMLKQESCDDDNSDTVIRIIL